MKFNENLKTLMAEQHISRKQLSNDLHIAYTTITDWINGKTIPRNKRLTDLAGYLHTTVDNLLNATVSDNIIDINQWDSIPVIGTIACGEPILAEENIESYQPFPTNLLKYHRDIFALRCKGNSMDPTIKDGSLVIIHQQPDVEENEIAAVLINDQATLKRVKHTEDGKVILMPDNHEYSPIILDKNDDNRILGKAINVMMINSL